ncbi:ureidoglycolate dehydrogenase [Escherichia coli]|uniref:Ureidoglycolate dehydrogenase n=1 Tax=Escherichia coli TaxID=562 RepID=A0A485JII9_ECOLX|nr:ureidoglycolate dehydrogenase [Escherichia coli]
MPVRSNGGAVGGAEIYYGTNPLAFAAPGEGDEILTFDMATTVQAWGKVLDARSRNMSIPDTWAVDKNGAPTTDPFAVNALLPAAGPKGYGLMMMIDVLSGVLLGLPSGDRLVRCMTIYTPGVIWGNYISLLTRTFLLQRTIPSTS